MSEVQRPREFGVNSKKTGTMAMPRGININDAFYSGDPPSRDSRGKLQGDAGKKDKTTGTENRYVAVYSHIFQ